MTVAETFPTFTRAFVHLKTQLVALGTLAANSGPYLRGILVLGYFALECLYCFSLPLVMDEFGHAKHIARVFESVPYRDYTPYKPLVGLLIQAPALYLVNDPWWSLIAVKLEMALLVTVCLHFMGRWLARRYGELPTLAALALLITHSTFLERSADLRVDMLATLAGTAAFAALIERQMKWAGACAGLSVLMTQKGVYFPLAAGVAVFVLFLLERSRTALRDGLAFVGAGLSVGLAYLVIALAMAGGSDVTKSLFTGPSAIAFDALYPETLNQYWRLTMKRDPIAYGAALAGFLLCAAKGMRRAGETTLLVCSATLLLLCAHHKQPWPYFFVFFLPTCAIVTAAGLSHFRRRDLGSYALACVVLYGSWERLDTRVPIIRRFDPSVQENLVRAGDSLLPDGELYLSGLEFLWREKHVPSLSWLDYPRVKHYREHPEDFLKIAKSGPTALLLIDNFRIYHLPPVVHAWLDENYVNLGHNFRLYAPKSSGGHQLVNFGLAGEYKIRCAPTDEVNIEGVGVARNEGRVTLSRGPYKVRSSGEVRFVSWPSAHKPERFEGKPTVPLFGNVYRY